MTEVLLPGMVRELRHAVAPVRDVEWRGDTGGTGDGSYTLTGYAAVFGEETTLWDSRFYRLREVIQRGAFTDVLSRDNLDCHLVVGHNMDLPMARIGVQGVGVLELSEDDRGLRVFARVDPAVSYIADLARLMRSGVVDQMSFAFTVAEDTVTTTETSDGVEDELRTITRIGELFDVTVCPRGAYPQTSATVRSLERAAGRTFVGREEAAPGVVGDSSNGRLYVAKARAHARARETQIKVV